SGDGSPGRARAVQPAGSVPGAARFGDTVPRRPRDGRAVPAGRPAASPAGWAVVRSGDDPRGPPRNGPADAVPTTVVPERAGGPDARCRRPCRSGAGGRAGRRRPGGTVDRGSAPAGRGLLSAGSVFPGRSAEPGRGGAADRWTGAVPCG